MVMVAVMAIAFLALSHASRPLQAVGGEWNGRSLLFPATIWTAPWLLVEYVLRFLMPLGLSIDYVVDPVTSPFMLRGVIGWGGLLLFMVLMVMAPRLAGPHHPWLRLGAGWTLAFFLPVSNLLPLFNPLADRYAYAMLPGLVLMTGAFAMSIRSRAHQQALALLLALILGGLSSVRLTAWQSDAVMWTAVLDVQPASDRAHTWLGLLAKADGNRDLARDHFQRARDLNPREVTAAINLAILDGEAGRLRAAEQQLRDVLARRPDHREARANLAVALDLQGRTAEAQAIRHQNDKSSD